MFCLLQMFDRISNISNLFILPQAFYMSGIIITKVWGFNVPLEEEMGLTMADIDKRQFR